MIEGTLFIRHHNGEVEAMGPLFPMSAIRDLRRRRTWSTSFWETIRTTPPGEMGLRCVDSLMPRTYQRRTEVSPSGID